jgi:hypothetical protein
VEFNSELEDQSYEKLTEGNKKTKINYDIKLRDRFFLIIKGKCCIVTASVTSLVSKYFVCCHGNISLPKLYHVSTYYDAQSDFVSVSAIYNLRVIKRAECFFRNDLLLSRCGTTPDHSHRLRHRCEVASVTRGCLSSQGNHSDHVRNFHH